MNDWMIFAERLSEQIKKQNLSIRQLAKRMDMTPTTIFRYAKGQFVPRATEILKASDALGVTCDYLLGLSDDPKKASRLSAQPESIEQIRWERDTAIQQLADLGYGLGEKPRTDGNLISRQDFDKFLEDAEKEAAKNRKHVFASALNTIRGNLKIFPSAQPEREKGAWIATYSDCGPDVYVTWKCCHCGYVRKKGWEHTDAGKKPDALFCEVCGADMRGEQP